MTIQDALERAKRLGKERTDRDRVTPPSHNAQSTIAHEPVASRTIVVEKFPDLEAIEFNSRICAENNILISDDASAAAAHAAASYRLLRGRVLHRIKGSNWTTIGITSAGASEGKTTTVVNLALSIAREKLRDVYLFDLDMRNPSVFKKLGCVPSVPLTQYFTASIGPEHVLYRTNFEHLMIAGATSPERGASEMLASPKFDELLRYARRRSPNALVLVDLPPALSTDEALVVAPRIDSLFIVVAEGVTRRDALARTMDVLGDFSIAGIIMNRSSERLDSDYYGY
jgi:Mrp family chromosome partitioning ATPase